MKDLMREAHKEVGAQRQRLGTRCVHVRRLTSSVSSTISSSIGLDWTAYLTILYLG